MTCDEIITAIMASLIAAIIFWLVFNFIPNQYEKKKVKPMIDFDLYQIYFKLAFFLEKPFRQSQTMPMHNQHLLYDGWIAIDDFSLFLSTKCLSEEYQLVDEMAKRLIPIGGTLKKYSEEIQEMIQRTYVFNKYLTAEQILLCRKIADNISKYDYGMNAFEKYGNKILHPVDPTIRYMSKMFFDLYQLFLQLQNLLIKQKSTNEEFGDFYGHLYRRGIWSLYGQKRYKDVVKRTKKSKDNNLRALYFRSLLHLGKTEEGVEKIKVFLHEDKEKLIYQRGHFSEFLDNQEVVDALVQERSLEEYQEMVNCLHIENEQYNGFVAFAHQMKDYYDRKTGKK